MSSGGIRAQEELANPPSSERDGKIMSEGIPGIVRGGQIMRSDEIKNYARIVRY